MNCDCITRIQPDEVGVVVVSVNFVEGDLAVDDEGARRVPPVGVHL